MPGAVREVTNRGDFPLVDAVLGDEILVGTSPTGAPIGVEIAKITTANDGTFAGINARLDGAESATTSAVTLAQTAYDLAIAGSKQRSIPARLLVTDGTLPAAMTNGATVGGLVLAAGNRIGRATPGGHVTDGMWVVQAAGAATRAPDLDTGDELFKAHFSIAEGSHAGEVWAVMNITAITVGSTPISIELIDFANVSSAEIGMARNGRPSLKDRIDDVETTAKFGALSELDAEEGVVLNFLEKTFVSRSLTDSTKNKIGLIAPQVGWVRNTAKIYTRKDGLYESAAVNVATYEYDGQGARPVGISVHPESQSRFHYSNLIGLWTSTGLNAVANAAVGPDGVMNATLLTPNGTNGAHRTFATASAIAAVGAKRTVSFEVQRPPGSLCNIRISSTYSSGKTLNADYNLTAGTVVLTGGTGVARIRRKKDNWWRISLSHASDYDFMQPTFWLLDHDMSFSHAGTHPIYVCKARADGGNAELSPVDFGHATNYITTGADKPSFALATVAAPVGNVGTITGVARPSEDGTNYGRILAQIGDDNNCIRITNGPKDVGAVRAQVIVGGSPLATSPVSAPNVANGRFRFAFAWREKGFSFSVNGVPVGDVSVTMPNIAWANLYIGCAQAATGMEWWGLIEKLCLTPRELSHEEIWGGDAAAGATNAIVLVASGQSNMFGGRTGGDTSINPNVFAWNIDTLSWQIANLASKPFAQGFGGLPLANNIAFHAAKKIQEETGRPVYLILHAWSGQPLRKWAKVGERPLRDTLFAEVVSALAALGRTTIDAFLWHQGEGDANFLRNFDTFGPTDGDVRPEYPSEHLYRAAALNWIADIKAQSWCSSETKLLFGELVQGGLSGGSRTDDRNDVWSNIGRYGDNLFSVPSAGLTTDATLHHFDGAGCQYFGYRYAHVFLGYSPGVNYDPIRPRDARMRSEITTDTDAVPIDTGQRDMTYWMKSASPRSLSLDPLDHADSAEIVLSNESNTGGGTMTFKPGVAGSRIFALGGTVNPASLTVAPGTAKRLKVIADGGGSGKAWQELPPN